MVRILDFNQSQCYYRIESNVTPTHQAHCSKLCISRCGDYETETLPFLNMVRKKKEQESLLEWEGCSVNAKICVLSRGQ